MSSEIAPFAKTGGLGDVCGALPRAIAARGHRVVTVAPYYRSVKARLPPSQAPHRGSFWVWLFGSQHELHFHVHEVDDYLAHVFIDNPMYDRDGIYGDKGGEFGDNLLRYAALCRAALSLISHVPIWGAPLGDIDVLHGHDWHGSLAALYHQALYKPLGLLPGTRTVLTIHNAAHQGRYSPDIFGGLDLAPRHLATTVWNGQCNLLKAGIAASEVVTAVSPTFAQELCTQSGGFGLDPLLREARARAGLIGVLNGIDTDAWDPAKDPAIAAPYDPTAMDGKATCKAALQAELGLPQDPGVPLFGMVSRLDPQKGADLLLGAARFMAERPFQLVVLGTGDPALEQGLRDLQHQLGDKVRAHIGFDVAMARRIFAGSDFCLVPSIFEPCGLTQMYAMRYGSVPVVRSTGGLRDSVAPYDADRATGTGFLFEQPSPGALALAMEYARRSYADKNAIATMQRNGMTHDWSWAKAAEQFEMIYA